MGFSWCMSLAWGRKVRWKVGRRSGTLWLVPGLTSYSKQCSWCSLVMSSLLLEGQRLDSYLSVTVEEITALSGHMVPSKEGDL